MTGKLLKEERQELIWELLQKEGKVTVAELGQRFAASEVTIRRDLAELAEQGKLRRSHRGALAAIPAPPEPPVVQRMDANTEEKERICAMAATLLVEESSIFLGSGSTTTMLARQLAGRKSLTIVTNSIGIAQELAVLESQATVVVTGGMLRHSELALEGYLTELMLKELHYSKVIMGARALSLERGWTTDYLPEIHTTRKIAEITSELIILADHTKLGKIATGMIVPIERISTLITDEQADEDFLEAVEKLGVTVIKVKRHIH